MYSSLGFHQRSKGALSTYASLLLLLSIITSLVSSLKVFEEENELMVTSLRAMEVNMALLNIKEELRNMIFVTISNSLEKLLMESDRMDYIVEVNRTLREHLESEILGVVNECIDSVADDYGVKVFVKEINIRAIANGGLTFKVDIIMEVRDRVLGISKMESLSLKYNTGISLKEVIAENRYTLERIEKLLANNNYTVCRDIVKFVKQLDRNITSVIYNEDSVKVERNIEVVLINERRGLFELYIVRVHLMKLIIKVGINEYDQITRNFDKEYVNLVVPINRDYDIVVLVVKKNVL